MAYSTICETEIEIDEAMDLDGECMLTGEEIDSDRIIHSVLCSECYVAITAMGEL